MTYQLGIDVGTTSVVAAVRRADGSGGPSDGAELAPLGGGGAAVPCALHLARDGGVTVGEGALRLAGIDPGRVVRALPGRVGDPTPITVGGATWTAEDLFARLLRWVVERVAEHEGGPAARIALAHPAPWAADTLERLAAALAAAGVPVTFVAAPVAVAHAAHPGSAPGDTVAVYDLGGGRFDAAVVRRGDSAGPGSGFGVLGRPEGLPGVGGLALDDLVWQHVRAGLPAGVVLDARVRRACLRAKETLSTKAAAVVRVRQGDLRGEVRLDRGTFEGLVAAQVDRTVVALGRAVASAGLTPDELTAVLLVGGSSRIPLVADVVSARLGRPVTLLDDAGWVACGAALAVPGAADAAGPAPAPGSGAVPARAGAPVLDTSVGPDQGDPGRSAVAVTKAASAAEPERVPSLPEPSPVVVGACPRDEAVEAVVAAGPVAADPLSESDTAKFLVPELGAADTVVLEAVASGAVTTDRVAAGPVVREPVVREPVVREPVVREPAQPTAAAAGDTVVLEAVASKAVTTGRVAAGPVVPGPVVPGPVVPEPAQPVATSQPAAPEPAVPDAVVPSPVTIESVVPESAVPEPTQPAPAAAQPAAPGPRAVPVRTPAVLDAGSRRGPRSRSLPRLLVGAGAVVAAALVVVALFRPDGPLDPPLDPNAVAPRITTAPVVPMPLPPGQAPAVEGLPVEGAPAAVRMTEPLRTRPLDNQPTDEGPAHNRPGTDGPQGDGPHADGPHADVPGDAVRSPVGPVPPADPDVRMTGPGPAARGLAPRAEGLPVGAVTRLPPTPAAPLV